MIQSHRTFPLSAQQVDAKAVKKFTTLVEGRIEINKITIFLCKN